MGYQPREVFGLPYSKGLTSDSRELAIENTTLICQPTHVMCSVNITWANAVRHILYDMTKIDPQPDRVPNLFLLRDDFNSDTENQIIYSNISGYRDWADQVGETLPYRNSFVILDDIEYSIPILKRLRRRVRWENIIPKSYGHV